LAFTRHSIRKARALCSRAPVLPANLFDGHVNPVAGDADAVLYHETLYKVRPVEVRGLLAFAAVLVTNDLASNLVPADGFVTDVSHFPHHLIGFLDVALCNVEP